MKSVYFVRHGEAEVNLATAEAFGGPESPLTERGWQQARLIATRAAKLQAQALIASGLRRAQETAQVIADETGLTIETTDLFAEAYPPSATIGQRRDDDEARALTKEWEQSFYTEGVRVADGDNFDDMRARAQEALRYLEERLEDEILVVTHGHFLRYLIGIAIFGEAFSVQHAGAMRWGIRTSNTGITRMRFDPDDKKHPGWYLSVWNDHAHLG